MGKNAPTPFDRKYGLSKKPGAIAGQRWLDDIAGGRGYLPEPLVCEHPLIIDGRTEISSPDPNVGYLQTKAAKVTDKADPDYGKWADRQYLLANRNMVGSGDSRIDRDIHLYGVGFRGASGTDPSTETRHDFVDFIGVDGLKMSGCKLWDRFRDGLILSNCIDYAVTNNEFTGLGDRRPYATVGAGTWAGGMAIFCYSPCFNGLIANNNIHDCPGGGGIWLPVTNTAVPNAHEGEFTLCVSNVLTNLCDLGIAAGDDCIVSKNTIRGVSLGDQSGNGIEYHGKRAIMADNDISDCAVSCITALNLYSGIIERNTFDKSPNLLILTSVGAWSGAGDVAPRRVMISANKFRNTDGNGLRALLLGNLTDAANLMQSIVVDDDNDFGAKWQSGQAIDYYPARDKVAGKGFMVPA